MSTFSNIAAYKFAPLDGLKPLRTRLLERCEQWQLKGSILLSTEGINIFVAGAPEKVDLLVGELRAIPGLEMLQPKVSVSEQQPFNRMLVRIKKEIIAFGVPGINPGLRTSPKLAAATLKQWLDEGKPITLLDTRNDYEIKLGTFKNAVALGIDHFKEFPQAIEKLPAALKEQPVVMFCTGGIRCEKAGPFMERAGFKNILQLDGGILKYFEECGGDHYEGECFVFDQRVGIDPTLQETESDQCFQCQTPLTSEEQKDPRYVQGKSCPYCAKTSAEVMALNLAARHKKLAQVITPLPGSTACDNYRPVNVPAKCEGNTVQEFLKTILPHVPLTEWQELAAGGLLVNDAHEPLTLDHEVHAGDRCLRKQPGMIEPAVNANLQILHEDEALIVLNKPAPLPMHPGGRFNRNTLEAIIHKVYYPQKPRSAHRLDANTTGVLLFTRTRHFAGRLMPQFARGEVKKIYLVRVQGRPPVEKFECSAPISAEPNELGARIVDAEAGQAALTEFTALSYFADGTTLLAARPHTGRTNQIRIHLWQLNLPVCGDQTYLPENKLGGSQTLSVDDPPLCLHSWRIEFAHPLNFQRTQFTAPAPAWAEWNDRSFAFESL